MTDSPRTISDAELRDVLGPRAHALLNVAGRLAAPGVDAREELPHLLTRPLLGVILSQSTQLEELLDACGALGNSRWRGFRGAVAAMKLFARVHYSLVHLAQAAPLYHLLPVEADLDAALREARGCTASILRAAARRLVEKAAPLGLEPRPVEVCEERLPGGRLEQDCPIRHVADVAGTVARLATAFLNLAEEAAALGANAWARARDQQPLALPDEPELRRLSEDFHNLQALYDTYVARTDAERGDPELRSLRGHASVVYHLLEIATDLRHYHERHVLHAAEDAGPIIAAQPDCLAPERLESTLRDCALAFSARYVAAGRSLAQQLLRRYAEEGEINVPVPRYRGFHVRPSTLVARVAYHYGSPVTMTLDDETYDASSPLELFRANERINARKRRSLAQEIALLLEAGAGEGGGDAEAEAEAAAEELDGDLGRVVRKVVLRLAEEAKVILYEHPLPRLEGRPREGQPVLSFVVDAIARLQALGKVDIVTPVWATFRGDRRVLADLQLLASSGYGEDAYGNNIALPDELRYLRR